MAELQVFFDYACPYCLRAHEYFEDLQGTEIRWMPCEAHPRPERHGRHSDLLARGMYIAQAAGADLAAYHRLAYRLAVVDRMDIENSEALAGALAPVLPPQTFLTAIEAGQYEDRLAENNRLAWETHGFSAVPSCVMDGRKLVSAEGVGLTRNALAQFVAGR